MSLAPRRRRFTSARLSRHDGPATAQLFEHGGISGRRAHHRRHRAGLAVGQVLDLHPSDPFTRVRMAVADAAPGAERPQGAIYGWLRDP